MKKRLIVLAVLIAVLLAAEWQVKSNYAVSSVSADGHWQIANYANVADPKNTWASYIITETTHRTLLPFVLIPKNHRMPLKKHL